MSSFRELLAEGQRDHPADAVPDEHRGAVAREGEHGFEVGREVLKPIVIVVRLLRQAQPRLVPDDQPEPVGQVAFLVEPFGTIGAPAVRPDDRRGVRRTVALNPELAAVGPFDAMNGAGPLAREGLCPLQAGFASPFFALPFACESSYFPRGSISDSAFPWA